MAASKSFQRDQAHRDSLVYFNQGLKNNFKQFQNLGQSALADMIQMYAMQGRMVAQDASSSIASLGAGSSGAGAVSRSLAQSYTANQAARARFDFTNQNLDRALQATGLTLQQGQSVPMEESIFSPKNVIAGAGVALAPFTGGASLAMTAGASQFGKPSSGGDTASYNQTAPLGQLQSAAGGLRKFFGG